MPLKAPFRRSRPRRLHSRTVTRTTEAQTLEATREPNDHVRARARASLAHPVAEAQAHARTHE
eukprot:2689979-Pleurochrysis_carterae.AAC.1